VTATSPGGRLTAEQVKEAALALGFVACGITDLAPVPHGDALDRWLAAGYAGTMRYLHRQARKRKDPRRVDPAPRTAIVVLDNYFDPAPLPATGIKVARYARGDDYHRVTMRRLYQVSDLLRAHGATYARAFADSGPLPERELAMRAGLGWIGKNTMLIRPGVGSWCVIGSVLTDLHLERDAPFTTDHCGSCTRCLDACPTQAFVGERVLDATRCISYLTIEQKGPIPDELVPKLDGWGFGCDICNEVCPWNERFATATTVPAFRPRQDAEGRDAAFFERMSEKEFAERYAGTALERAGIEGLRRNARAVERGRPTG
jgi:epoxyqueuosine reductase